MATYSVLPDTLDIVFIQGDELSIELDFDQDLTGYTFEHKIVQVTAVSGGNVTAWTYVYTFTRTDIDLSQGRMNLSLQETQTQALTLGLAYRWWFRWKAPGDIRRTVLSGSLSVQSP